MTIQLAVVGGGIAGLWTLRRALAQGYNAVLLEQDVIGGGQTLASQGILHGGLKYGLDGASRDIASLLQSMPPRWRDCLAGAGEIDLSGVHVHTDAQHLWASESWLEKLAAAAGARVMHGAVQALARPAWPAALRDGGHVGSVYAIAETVLDVKSLCQALAEPVRERIFRAAVSGLETGPDGTVRAITAGGRRLTAQAFLFTAATGNESAAAWLGFGPGATQRRPLRQLLVRGRLPLLYGHCVALSHKPSLTVTSHPWEGETVWYLGGGVADEGLALTPAEAIANGVRHLQKRLPGFDWAAMSWAVWDVDRAEPQTAGRLPDGPLLRERGNAAVCWPTKLVYAPALADQALAFVGRQLRPAGAGAVDLDLPPAEVGRLPWERVAWQARAGGDRTA